MPLPNFLIFGAAKSGTTSLQMYLKQHPEVFFPDYKEPNFYALEGYDLPRLGPAPPEVMQALIYSRSIVDREHYESLFLNPSGAKASGEASVRYLYFKEAPEKISQEIPNVKLIAVLREPVSRLYSHYCMNRQYQLEPLELLEAVEAEDERIQKDWGWDWHYKGLGMYSAQLQRYFDRFDRSQIKVFFYEEFQKEPQRVIRECFEHLSVNPDFVPDMQARGKVAYRGRNQALDRWLHWPSSSRKALTSALPGRVMKPVLENLRKWNSSPVPRLQKEERQSLEKHFVEDLTNLETLLQRKVPWLP